MLSEEPGRLAFHTRTVCQKPVAATSSPSGLSQVSAVLVMPLGSSCGSIRSQATSPVPPPTAGTDISCRMLPGNRLDSRNLPSADKLARPDSKHESLCHHGDSDQFPSLDGHAGCQIRSHREDFSASCGVPNTNGVRPPAISNGREPSLLKAARKMPFGEIRTAGLWPATTFSLSKRRPR
jgi:hypothetical protein